MGLGDDTHTKAGRQVGWILGIGLIIVLVSGIMAFVRGCRRRCPRL